MTTQNRTETLFQAMKDLPPLRIKGECLIEPDDQILYALAPEMAEALRKLVLLCPSPEGLGGHAPIAAFIQLGEAARAILARLPQKGGEK